MTIWIDRHILITWKFRPRKIPCRSRRLSHRRAYNIWCELTPEALAIIEALPRRGDLVFPYNSQVIGRTFTNSCKELEIEDLHFHDLRHDGVSRLFEMGRTIPQVAAVSAHRSWHNLKRYTHIAQTGDKYAGWKWLEIVTQPMRPPVHMRPRGPCSAST